MKRLFDRWEEGCSGYLFFSLGFLYIVSAHFDSWRQDGTGELHDIHAEQVAKFLSG